ncbi:MAG: SpoIIE family protein phosphatase [Bacteroidales bacterium]|nr:SpoIIE family protein phosphatase [Bacteroidales bacterium]
MDVTRKSPAWNAGIEPGDKVIFINDSLVSKKGLTLRETYELLFDKPGEPIKLQIIRDAVDTIMNFSLIRDESSSTRHWFDYEYLVDSSGIWTIEDILSDSIGRLFSHILDAKLRILTVEEGSVAAVAGLKPGDRIFSLSEALDNHNHLCIDEYFMGRATMDTSIEVLRDGIEVNLELNPQEKRVLDGITSQFGADFMQSCVWLKFKISSRISSDQTYIFNVFSAADSMALYEPGATGSIVKKAGLILPNSQKDFVYKEWEAFKIHLRKDQEQTFYIRMNADGPVFIPYFKIVPLETVTKFDRLERMILASFAGMMILICFYYLILFVSSRRKQFLFYPLFIISFLIMLLYNWGYYAEFTWGQAYITINDLFDLIFALPFCFFLLFGIYYLDLRSNLKLWYRIAIIDLWVLVISNIILNGYFLLAKNEAYNAYTEIMIFITGISSYIIPPVLLLIVTILRLIKGFIPARYFLTAFLVLALLLLFQETRPDEFSNAEVHVSNFSAVIGNSAVLLGAILQFLIFSLGLANKMKIDEKEKKLAQERIIEQLRENEELKDKVNRELEQKVRERTEEIMQQKEEIETQRDVLSEQKNAITDSINYAQRIQSAVLPHKEYMDEVMPEYFVLFKPRDIVSGDFYWIKEVKNYLIVVAADCTGHGVPGAFMSMLGITLLNEQIGKSRFDRPGEILNRLRKKVKDTLAQEGNYREQKDGMDIALVIFNKDTLELQFAGAFNPLYLVRKAKKLEAGEFLELPIIENDNYQLIEFKGDRQPISIYFEETDFATKEIQLRTGDAFYLFSDGFVDQVGGPQRKKFLSKRFKKSLLEIQSMSMKEQHQYLNHTLEEWSKGYEQIDDILVMGIRV